MDLFIISNGNRLPVHVKEDFEPEFTYKNSATEYNSIPGEFAFNVKLPIEGNAKTFQHAHHLSSELNFRKYACQGYSNGELVLDGFLLLDTSISSSASGEYTVNIIAVDFPSILSNLTLPQVCDEIVEVGIDGVDIFNSMKTRSGQSYPATKVVFPTFVNEVYNDDEVFEGIINPYSQNAENYDFDFSAIGTSDESYTNRATYSPMVYLAWIIAKIEDATNYRITGVTSQAWFQKIVHATNFGIEVFKSGFLAVLRRTSTLILQNTYIPFDEIEEDGHGNLSTGILPYVIGKRGLHKIRIELNVGFMDVGAMTIYFKTGGISGEGIEWVVSGANQLHILEGEFEFTSAAVGTSMGVFMNSFAENVEILANTRLRVINVTETTGWDILREVEGSKLVPNISVSQLLIGLSTSLNIRLTFNPVRKRVVMTSRADILSRKKELEDPVSDEFEKKYLDLPNIQLQSHGAEEEKEPSNFIGEYLLLEDLPDTINGTTNKVGNTAYISTLLSFYIYSVNEAANNFQWEYYRGPRAKVELSSGDGSTIALSTFSKIYPNRVINITGSEQSLVPVLNEEPGNSYSEVESEYLRLMFYHGLTAGNEGDYPFASCGHLDLFGDEILEYAFDLESNRGVRSRWLPWLSVMQSRTEFKIQTVTDLSAEQLCDAIWRIMNQNVVVKEIKHAGKIKVITCIKL